MTAVQKRISQYQFLDSKQLIYGTIVGHLLLAVLLILPDFTEILTSPRAQLCVVIALGLFLLTKTYDWMTSNINILIVLLFVALVIFEYFSLGIPATPIAYDVERHQVSKGIMFDMLMWILPYLYLVSRLFLGIPLLMIMRASNKLNAS